LNKLEEIRVGVIGVGGRGRLSDLANKPNQGSMVVAGADTSVEELRKFSERYRNKVFVTEDYRELLLRDDIDAVFICSPDYLHEEHAVAALNRRKAVYLEKPIAITTSGCDRILSAAKENESLLYVGHNMRHMPFVLKMKQLIADGAIGEVKAGWCRHFVGNGGDYYFKDWHAERRNTTGLLLQKGAHDIDVLHWLCSSYSDRVSAMGGLTLYDRVESRRAAGEKVAVDADFMNWPPMSQKNLSPTIDVEDISQVMMHLENGVYASYNQCHFTPDYWRNYTIIGSEGRIENLGDGSSDTVINLWNKRTSYQAKGDIVFAAPAESGSHGGADPAIVAEFLGFVRNGGRTTTSPVAARYSVAAGVAATESLRNGGIPVDVPPLSSDIVRYFDGVL